MKSSHLKCQIKGFKFYLADHEDTFKICSSLVLLLPLVPSLDPQIHDLPTTEELSPN